jgi:hypothetical protein
MRIVFRLAAILFATSFAVAVAQQEQEPLPEEEAEEEVEPIRRYTVELIVFAYGEGVSSGTEIWIPEERIIEPALEPVYGDSFGEFDEPLTEIEVPAVGRRYMDLELALLTEDDFTMNGIYDKLTKLEAYQPILRTGWTQPTYERDLTASIPLTTLAESPPWLEGKLTLYLGRYLHLVIDLTMDSDRTEHPAEDRSAAGVLSFGDSRIQNEYGAIDAYGNLIVPSVRYRIFEDRIMKNGDIRYFDHPKFGVVAKTTRFEEPEEEFIDDTDDLLPGNVLSP